MIKIYNIYSSFSVPDLEKAKEFYSNTLGLHIEERPEGLDLKISDGNKIFVYFSAQNKPADFTVLNLVVDDVEKEVDALLEKGVAMEHYDMPEIKTNQKGIVRNEREGTGPHVMAWFKDPAGNIIALSQKNKSAQ
jgi:catechol 2,3-dioxygenase-like lactoylglutathione lyase family enzyme